MRRTSVALAAFSALAIGPAPEVQTFRHENVLGTSLELKVATRSPQEASKAETAALAEIDRLARVLSGYDPASEFSRWAKTRGVAVPVSEDLFEALRLWDSWRVRTDGVLNPAAETASKIWKQAAAAQRAPSAAELATAAARMQAPHWKLGPGRTATRLDDAPLMLNSFTKSWIIDRALNAAMAAASIDGASLNIGGDIVARGAISERVSIADPRNDAENASGLGTLRLRDMAVATSGNYRRGFEINGQRYSHIIDPRTARPVDHVASATVVASDPVTAGALATAFNVLTPAESERLAARTPGVEYMLIASNGRRFTSNGWSAMFAETAATTGPATLTLRFELARVSDGRYRRPYVAAWIEDKDHFPVRTIALWYEKPRWLPDLKAWSRADRLRAMAEGGDIAGSVSSATRSPGKYSVVWDGKDQHGKPVKSGKYTLYLEAAREHGTYQLMRQEIDLAAGGQFTLPGNTEVAGATVEVAKAR